MAIVLLFVVSCEKDSPIIETPPPEPPHEKELLFPKNEMRAVWIATAWGLDWPMGLYNVSDQKNLFKEYLDKFKDLNINTVIVQIKPMGDAFYQSPFEPWSGSITNNRGEDPGYDVLKFMIEETHKRDMEFHAWMNPYRISTRASAITPYPQLHNSIDPDWVVNHEKIQIYNPALPEVRQRLADIVKDIITKYDIDGIHFDDYFYPDPSSAGSMVSDNDDYQKYGSNYNNIEEFRRSNIDKAIELVHQTINQTNPRVSFTVSPASSHDYNYNTLYSNIRKWNEKGWIDIVMPQLYHEIGNSVSDFKERLNWWAQYSYDATLMIGIGLYKFGDPAQPTPYQSVTELQNQYNLMKNHKKVMGSALYSANYILKNKIGVTEKLKQIFVNEAVIPFVGNEMVSKPLKPSNLDINNNQLSWDMNSQSRFVVYYFKDIHTEGEVYKITNKNNVELSKKGIYCVKSINKDNRESDASNIIKYE